MNYKSFENLPVWQAAIEFAIKYLNSLTKPIFAASAMSKPTRTRRRFDLK
jgi:hypothetical protein